MTANGVLLLITLTSAFVLQGFCARYQDHVATLRFMSQRLRSRYPGRLPDSRVKTAQKSFLSSFNSGKAAWVSTNMHEWPCRYLETATCQALAASNFIAGRYFDSKLLFSPYGWSVYDFNFLSCVPSASFLLSSSLFPQHPTPGPAQITRPSRSESKATATILVPMAPNAILSSHARRCVGSTPCLKSQPTRPS